MSSLLSFLFRRQVRDRYPTKLAFLGELIGLLVSLTVYWYTARAFIPGSGFSGSYFDYLLIGEASLFLPLAFFHGLVRISRQTANEGVLELTQAFPIRGWRIISALGAALAPFELGRILLTLLIARMLFGFHADAGAILQFTLLQLIAAPAFLGLGLIASAIVLRFGRGETAIAWISSGAAILAGAYFPVSVLPESIQTLSNWLSPFFVLLEATRQALGQTSLSAGLMGPMTVLLVWGAITLPLGMLAVEAAFRHARKSGSGFLLT